MKTQAESLKDQCEELAALSTEFNAVDCPATVIKRFHKLREEVVPQVAELIDALARAGLVLASVSDGRQNYLSFQIENAGVNGGIDLGFKLHVVAQSLPPPSVKITGMER